MDDYDSDGGSPFGMMGMFSMMAPAMAMTMMLAASLWGVVILYVIARWRHNRAGLNDTQFGVKFALHLFRLHGYQLVLLGAFLLLFSVLAKGSSTMRSPIWRMALGFLTAGGVVFGVHTLMLGKTNQTEQPLLGRMFAGLSLLVTGMIGLVGVVAGMQALFAKGPMGNDGRMLWSLVFVYVTAWVVQGAIVVRAQLTTPSPDAAPPGPPGPGPIVPEPMRAPLA